jgi:hypothetical protein
MATILGDPAHPQRGWDLLRRLKWTPTAVFTRMYGTCTWEASVRQRKLSRVPLHLVGNRSRVEVDLPIPLSQLHPTVPPEAWASFQQCCPGVFGARLLARPFRRLPAALPEYSLERGDIGTVVLMHRGGEGYEVEFVTLDGETVAVVSLPISLFQSDFLMQLRHKQIPP